jgi:uncharacterized NAD(P)/FAD-binding protein YdhS
MNTDFHQPNKRIGIIGAGASGSCIFCNLVHHNCYPHYYIFDKNMFKGGIAFNSHSDELLCNTPNSMNSLFFNDPLDFYKYLISRGFVTSPNEVVPRRLFANYFTERLEEYTELARINGATVHYKKYHAKKIIKTSDNKYQIFSPQQDPVELNDIIDTRGVSVPIIPSILQPFQHNEQLINSPYPEYKWLPIVSENSKILVFGSRLSAIDTTLLLSGKKCQITLTSPSGNLPAVRNHIIRMPDLYLHQAEYDEIPNKQQYLKRLGYRLILTGLYRRSSLPRKLQIVKQYDPIEFLTKNIRLDQEDKNQWKDLIVEFVEIINYVGAKMTQQEMTLLKLVFQPLIEDYISSFPTQNAIKILKLMQEEQLLVRISNIENISFNQGKWQVRWEDKQKMEYDFIICATGFHRPMVYEGNNQYYLTNQKREGHAVTINAQQRIISKRTGKEERIWLAGVPAHIKYPLPLYFSGVTQQIIKIIEQQLIK